MGSSASPSQKGMGIVLLYSERSSAKISRVLLQWLFRSEAVIPIEGLPKDREDAQGWPQHIQALHFFFLSSNVCF